MEAISGVDPVRNNLRIRVVGVGSRTGSSGARRTATTAGAASPDDPNEPRTMGSLLP